MHLGLVSMHCARSFDSSGNVDFHQVESTYSLESENLVGNGLHGNYVSGPVVFYVSSWVGS